MTSMTITSDTTTAAPRSLDDLVGETGTFLTDVWGIRSQSFVCRDAPLLITQAEVWDMLDCGLVVAPYFSVVTPAGSPVAGVSETRSVQTKPLPSYARMAGIRQKVESGRILVLNQADHWHAALQDLVESLRATLRADVRSAVVLSPREVKLPTKADAAHRLILQLEGGTEWTVSGGSSAFTLQPGGILYIPAGHDYGAITGDAYALHVVITAQQPTAQDLLELVLAGFLDSPCAQRIAGSHHLMPPAEKVAWLRAELTGFLTTLDTRALAEEAITIRRGAGHA